ncbi:MAG: hypothetical protein HDT35_08015 [Clostridiales bacterium]|nr:hypothetical protein [Clostridiales bacterium]
MSLKSFDDFCAKMVNNEPIQKKEILDERQSIVRSRITIRALWAFIIMAVVNLLVMECGPQWCESWVLSTAIFGAIAYLYWVSANARQGSLFGINGTSDVAFQAVMLITDGILIPLLVCINGDNADFFTNFFVRNGMISEYFAGTFSCVLLMISAIVMVVNIRKSKRENKNR